MTLLDSRRRQLALIAMLGPAAFVALLGLLHALQPETNDTDAISEYALGDYGWLMNAAFFAAAVGVAALAVGLLSALTPTPSARVGIACLALAAIGWALLGGGNIDPEGAESTTHGLIHGIGYLTIVPSMFLALFLLARAFRWDERWRTLRRSVLALALAALAAFLLGFADVAALVFFRLYDGLLLVAVAVIAIRLRSLADPHAARDSTVQRAA
jgi:Protein of unknown function (DUF998)